MASKEQSRVSQAGDGVAKQSISFQGGDGRVPEQGTEELGMVLTTQGGQLGMGRLVEQSTQ